MTRTTDKTPPDAGKLIEQIRAAFQGVAYPGEHDLTDSTYGEEPEALVEDFRGKYDWSVLDNEFLDQAPDGWGSALSFFSGAALPFYLPAYLVADIQGHLTHNDPAVRLCAAVTAQLAVKKIARIHGGGTLGEYVTKQFSLFNKEQVDVIVNYLW